MGRYTPTELRDALGTGLLSFPVTHATADYAFDEEAYRAHLQHLNGFDVAGLFAAGGTGEFFSLTHDEVSRVLKATVEEVKDGTPVLGAAGYGTSQAVAMAQRAEADGADGILLLPPYLTELSSRGLYEHVARVCSATSLGVVVYHRANARYDADTILGLAAEFPNLIGFKDGICDIDLMATLNARLGDRLVYIGGLPTAETYALPYLELGASTYSSAIFNFAPRWAVEFYTAVRNHDRDEVLTRLRDFVVPYIAIRDRGAGYGVSIVKAGLTAAGRPAGPVRPPLTDLTEQELAELTALVKTVV
ncbi:5-dehydro-4-deoxyglucarate dehydratase [Nocardioides panzhihuensis]|uniref:Probable 5-dehydro-4-deoxyglucarate dehydratase n=1 Tax=Nocardioides panzhihuensis TaxID=860243 RepID=A0A7Z0DNG5_9ACTN|nr:5-dehydro-4-deoxyglucarate dehydratase [Nocardioides panzhihuensis]NYI78869.1 5-dehydro-4-deoxyglucarate dehydratase [Nocardioides panzhihuensis]